MGWFKVWSEETIEGDTWTDPEAFQLWQRLLILGGRGDGEGRVYDLQTGCGILAETLQNLCKIGAERYVEIITEFERKKMITINSCGVITICKWVHYQNEYRRQKGYRQGYKGNCNLACLFGVENPSPLLLSTLIRDYFLEIGSSEEEGKGFYDHFQSNGWKISGRAPMKDWKAAARNWVRRSKGFKQPSKTSDRFTAAGGIKGEPGKYDAIMAEAQRKADEREKE